MKKKSLTNFCLAKIQKSNSIKLRDLHKKTKVLVKKRKLKFKKNNPFSKNSFPDDINMRSVESGSVAEYEISDLITEKKKLIAINENLNMLKEKMPYLYDELRFF